MNEVITIEFLKNWVQKRSSEKALKVREDGEEHFHGYLLGIAEMLIDARKEAKKNKQKRR